MVVRILLLVIGFALSAHAASAQIQASVLPVSRSGVTGQPITVFATVVDAGNSGGTDCTVTLPDGFPANLDFQPINTSGGEIVFSGNQNEPFSIDSQTSLLLTFTPTSDFDRVEVELDFSCAEGRAPVYSGVNTVFLSSSATADTDIIPIAVTPGGGGLIQFDRESRRSAFAVAAVNIGASGNIRVRPSAPLIFASLTLQICETNPATGVCIGPRAAETEASFEASETRTFTVFAEVDEDIGIPTFYDLTRIYLIFESTDDTSLPGRYASPIIPSRAVFGATSIAVSARGPLLQSESGEVSGIHRGTLNDYPALFFISSFRRGFAIQFRHPADAVELRGTIPLFLGTMDALGTIFEDGKLALDAQDSIGRYSYATNQEFRGFIGSNNGNGVGANFRGAYDASSTDASLPASIAATSWTVRTPDVAIGEIEIAGDNSITGTITWPVGAGNTATAVSIEGFITRSTAQNQVEMSLFSNSIYYRFRGFVDARPGGNVIVGYVVDVGASVSPGESVPADFDVVAIEFVPSAE